MNTFIPVPSYKQSAYHLDNRRLNKQITECYQIYLALNNPVYGWKNHPAVKMWAHHEGSLVMYGIFCYIEWQRRFDMELRGGKRDHKSGEALWDIYYRELPDMPIESKYLPEWIGDERIHSSHRSCLLAKSYEWYSQFGWDEQPTPPDKSGRWPYYWPV